MGGAAQNGGLWYPDATLGEVCIAWEDGAKECPGKQWNV